MAAHVRAGRSLSRVLLTGRQTLQGRVCPAEVRAALTQPPASGDVQWSKTLFKLTGGPPGSLPLLPTRAVRQVAAEMLARVRGDDTSSVLLQGPEGIGKSTVLQSITRVAEHLWPRTVAVYVSAKDLVLNSLRLEDLLVAELTRRQLVDWSSPVHVRDLEKVEEPSFASAHQSFQGLTRALDRNGLRLVVVVDDVDVLWAATGDMGPPASVRALSKTANVASRVFVLRALIGGSLCISVVACTSTMQLPWSLSRPWSAKRPTFYRYQFVEGALPDDADTARGLAEVCDAHLGTQSACWHWKAALRMLGGQPRALVPFFCEARLDPEPSSCEHRVPTWLWPFYDHLLRTMGAANEDLARGPGSVALTAVRPLVVDGTLYKAWRALQTTVHTSVPVDDADGQAFDATEDPVFMYHVAVLCDLRCVVPAVRDGRLVLFPVSQAQLMGSPPK